MRQKTFFSDLGDDYGDYDDYDMEMDDETINDYGEDDDIDLDDDLDDDLYGYEGESIYDEDYYSEGDIDDEDDDYHEVKREMWRNMDWDKD